MAPVLGYWEIRGLVDPIRLVLNYLQVEYQEKVYKFGPPPEYHKNEWFNEKFTLGLDFPNVPYYIDGDVKMTQTLAILRHLGRKHGLNGKTEEDLIRTDMLEQAIWETLMKCFQAWYPKENFEVLLKDLDDNLASKLDQFSKFLGERKFVLGDSPVYVDFLLYTCLDFIRIYSPSLYGKHPSLSAFVSRVEALPGIDKFQKSGNFYRLPITSPFARFGGKKE